MEWSHIANDWDELAAKAAKKWAKLTPEELEGTRGERPHLVARISERYELTTEEAEKEVDAWADKL